MVFSHCFSGRWSSLSVYRGTTERDRTMNQGRLHQQLKGLMDSKIKSHKLMRQLLSYEFTENIEKVFISKDFQSNIIVISSSFFPLFLFLQ
jgi:hypothetical protein